MVNEQQQAGIVRRDGLAGCSHWPLAIGLLCLLPPSFLPFALPLERFEFTEPHMGTAVRVVLYAENAVAARERATAAFSRIAALDDRLSDYRGTSELMALSRAAGGPPLSVSEDLLAVLALAHTFSIRTGGAFDVTIGPVSHLWRRARATGEPPAASDLASAQRLVGYRKVQLSSHARRVRLSEPGMMLDLGGIAKGYAADEALQVLARRGTRHALVALGGDVAAGDAPPGTAGWEIGVAPLGPRGRAFPSITLQRAAISTSGDAEQYLDAAGTRYSHIVDPVTGSAATGRRGVTVIGPNAITADALATAIKVLGPERGLPIVEDTEGAAALVVDETNAGIRQFLSTRWPR
jgi:thiamine biosynthesis lipoprotein